MMLLMIIQSAYMKTLKAFLASGGIMAAENHT